MQGVLRRGVTQTATALIGTIIRNLGGMDYTQELRPDWVEITSVTLQLPRLAHEFDGYRIVQISDIHFDSQASGTRLDDVVKKINHLSPDFVAITGDFVTHTPENYNRELISSLKHLRARDGVAAVLGNHDHWAGPETVQQVIHMSGLRELSNSVLSLERGAACLYIAGVDSLYAHKDHLEKVLSELPESGAAILLAHEPDYADTSAASQRFDLQLSGHSHGGQVVLPLIGMPFLPRYCRKYPSGLYEVNNMFLYTNRGLGVVHLPIRYRCKPEITVFTLKSM